MCNPRRVNIHLNQAIEEAWRTTVEQTATAQDEVRERARLHMDIPLADRLGDQALAMLERILVGEFANEDPTLVAWEQDDQGNFRYQLGDLTLIYTPGSRQLQVETRLAETITAEERATAEASGFTIGEVAVEAVGHYYDDGWGGRTEENARREAEQQARRQLAEARETLHRREHAAELQQATAEAQAEAQRRAASELERQRGETRQALRQRLQINLANAQERVYHTMNRLVGEAYRRTLIQLVRREGGRVLSDQRNGSLIQLELEVF